MYHKKEWQVASSKGSLGKSAGTSSQQQQPEPPAPVVKESALLPPPPLQPDLSLPTLNFPKIELEGFGEDYVIHRTLSWIMVRRAYIGMFIMCHYTMW